MARWRRTAMIAATFVGVSVLAGPALAGPAAAADDSRYTFAVIGDIPYGSAAVETFPQAIAQINADPAVRWVIHLGDIKNGSSVCSDDYFQLIRTDFDQFEDPLVYTVGDNEWTDCHRPTNGGYYPLERLAKVREVFFPRPGYTLGQHRQPVASQAGGRLPTSGSWLAVQRPIVIAITYAWWPPAWRNAAGEQDLRAVGRRDDVRRFPDVPPDIAHRTPAVHVTSIASA